MRFAEASRVEMEAVIVDSRVCIDASVRYV